jgi:hypothetical protein
MTLLTVTGLLNGFGISAAAESRKFWCSSPLTAKADLTLGLGWWRHELADGIEHHFELGIVFALKVGNLACQVLVRGQRFPELDKGTDYEHTHLDGERRVEDTGDHDRAVLGEGKWQVAPTTVLS